MKGKPVLKGKSVPKIDVQAINELMKDDKEALRLLPEVISSLLNRNVYLVAVSGKKGSGKDTFTAAVAERMNKSYHIHAYAYELKSQAQSIFDLLVELYEGDLSDKQIIAKIIKDYNMQGIPNVERNLKTLMRGIWDDLESQIRPNSYKRSPGVWRGLQILGTDIRRQEDPDYWVKKTLSFVIKKLSEGTSVYISDVRFTNELRAMEILGAPTVRMWVTPEVQRQRLIGRDGSAPTAEALNHPSETELDNAEFDYVIDNNGDISIDDNADQLVKSLLLTPLEPKPKKKHRK